MLDLLTPGWLVFAALVVALFTIDLIWGSRGRDVGTALRWSVLWVGSGLAFGLWVWGSLGATAATEYYAAYLLEKSLSIDNIFVFVLIFSQLNIPLEWQHRVLLIGVVSALVMRAIMIWVGVYLLTRFHWVMYPFAALLLIAALRLLFGESTERRLVQEACAACGTWVARIIPVTPYMPDQRFFLHRGGRWVATPLFVALTLSSPSIPFPPCSASAAIPTSSIAPTCSPCSACARSTSCWRTWCNVFATCGPA